MEFPEKRIKMPSLYNKEEINKSYRESVHLIMAAHNQIIKRIIERVKSGAV